MNSAYLKKQQNTLFQIDTVPEPPKPRNFRVQCTVLDRDMTASVKIIPMSEECDVTEFEVLAKLFSNGVRVGIDYERISQMVAEKWVNQEITVARGTDPENGEDASIEPLVMLEEFTTPELLKQFPGQRIIKGVPVDLDEPLVQKHPATPGTPGFTVRGRRLDPQPGADVDFEYGEQVSVSADGLQLLAAMPGLVGLSKGLIAVKDAEYDAWKYDVKIRRNGMEAVLTIIPGMSKQPEHDESWFQSLMDRHNIAFGADRDTWRFIPSQIRSTFVRTIAEGEPPVPEGDAELVELYRAGSAQGQIMFRVASGDLLVEKLVGRKGARGRNVFDEPVPPPQGKDVLLEAGPGTRLSEDGLKLFAELDGFVCRIKNAFAVVEGLSIDPAGGGLQRVVNHNGVVIINGSVPQGYAVVAAQHVEIHGDVMAAHVIAGGDLRIHGKVAECAKTKVQAGGDMIVGRAEKSRLRAEKAVYIETDLLNCEVISGGGVFEFTQGSTSLLGGSIVTGNGVAVYNLGATSSPATRLLAGVPFPIRTHFEHTARELADNVNKFGVLNAQFIQLHKLLLARQLPTEQAAVYKKLRLVREVITEKIKLGKAKLAKLHQACITTSRNTTIKARGAVYPGVVVKIANQSFIPKSRLDKCVFNLTEDFKEVQMNKL